MPPSGAGPVPPRSRVVCCCTRCSVAAISRASRSSPCVIERSPFSMHCSSARDGVACSVMIVSSRPGTHGQQRLVRRHLVDGQADRAVALHPDVEAFLQLGHALSLPPSVLANNARRGLAPTGWQLRSPAAQTRRGSHARVASATLPVAFDDYRCSAQASVSHGIIQARHALSGTPSGRPGPCGST